MGSFIKNYPVDNGDLHLISIDENSYKTNVIVDCNIREASKGATNASMYDVKADLMKSLNRKSVNGISNVAFTDIFILTHGDEDHLLGFEKNFYQGDPKDYKQKNKENEEILIDVLWFSPMVMGKATNDDEHCFNKEAKRRIQLHRSKSSEKDNPGNRIVIVGYDANEDLSGLDLVRKVPGDIVTRFNNRDLTTFSIFIHSPYQQHLSDDDVEKNDVSIVFQARFKDSKESQEFCALALFGGDANHEAWACILEKTKKHKNDVTQQALKWDIFVACHHCSWSFFNEHEEDEPTKTSLETLEYGRKSAKVIASCKEIKDNDDNPPSFRAKKQYIKKVGEDNFLCTATSNKVGQTPQPIVFEIKPGGPMPPKKLESTAIAVGSSATSTLKQPSTYGAL